MAKRSQSSLSKFDASALVDIVRTRRCLLIRLNDADYYGFLSRADLGRPFTMAAPPGVLQDTRVPTLCFIFGDDYSRISGSPWAGGHIGVLTVKRPLTAIEYGVKIIHSLPIVPAELNDVIKLIPGKAQRRALSLRLSKGGTIVSLPPEMSAQFVRAIASKNVGSFTRLLPLFTAPRERTTVRRAQADAIETALRVFGLQSDAQPAKLDVPRTHSTELSEYWLREDSVIEHDARSLPGFQLTNSHVTGRALFRRDNEVLEVITANRRPLERVLGVDLIYHNVQRKCLVMVQYKMLDPAKGKSAGSDPDWVYRPDRNLAEELRRMKQFAKRFAASPGDYRLNSQMFYLKFVRRDKIGSRAAITLSLEHFEQLPKAKGKRGVRRVSYRALNGAYLRDDAFFGLIRAGYIGSYSNTTAALLPLVNALVKGNRAVVVGIQNALLRVP